jgi:hypothetical protein
MIETTLAGAPVEVDGLDAEWLLELVAESEAAARQADRRKLRLAAQWCVLHEVSDEDESEQWRYSGKSALDCDEAIGGAGTPLVAAFTAEPFAAAMGISTAAGMSWLSDALDLPFRLPRIGRLADELVVPVWRARRVAALTRALSEEAAGFVDEQLAPVLAERGMPTVERVVAAAIARFTPTSPRRRRSAGRRAGTSG